MRESDPVVYDLERIVDVCGCKTVTSENLKPEYRGDAYCLVLADRSGVFDNNGVIEKNDTPARVVLRFLQEKHRLHADIERLRLYFGVNGKAMTKAYEFSHIISHNPERISELDAELKL
jgi:hypothetical protein